MFKNFTYLYVNFEQYMGLNSLLNTINLQIQYIYLLAELKYWQGRVVEVVPEMFLVSISVTKVGVWVG